MKMDQLTIRFLRDWLIAGLPMGTLIAIYGAIGQYVWWQGAIGGAIVGLEIGLAYAFRNAREFSKNVHNIDDDQISQLGGDAAKFVFRQRFFSFETVFFPMALISVLFICSLFNLFDERSLRQAIFFTVICVVMFVLAVFESLIVRLTVSAAGIEIRSFVYTIKVGWSEVERIERRGKRWFLVCRTSEITAVPLVSAWLKFLEEDQLIQLDRFTAGFVTSELVDAIFHFHKLKIVST